MNPVSPRALGLLIASLAMSAVMAQSAAESTPAITDPEAYAVYAAVLPQSVLDDNHRGPIAIQLETFPGPADCPRAALITDEWRAAVDDYRKQNAATKFIRPGFDLGTAYSLVAWADVRVERRMPLDSNLSIDWNRCESQPRTVNTPDGVEHGLESGIVR